MAESQKAPVKRGGRYCVCGGPGGVSCKNSTHTPGIILHKFPSEKTRPDERRLWTKFVRRHRTNFSPTQYSVVCSAHFEPSCYPQSFSLDIPEHLRPKARYLKPDALPTIDAVPVETDKLKSTPVSKRQSRMVNMKREDAIKRQKERRQKTVQLIPAALEQDTLLASQNELLA
ncbi:THAP domain-containing 2-like [Paramuricea clavata]|uniref:THAP domain-containing 2-like n=1 Tax=Paramuricea clavata TaxID=317549 RepID=A0A7D9EDK0_PARCT|nr:THAP domain-containing 2-like [Paramuricea clavata]